MYLCIKSSCLIEGSDITDRVMKPFLHEVAESYYTHYPDLLGDCCFVFPQKRAGRLFAEHLAGLVPDGQLVMMPKVTTIVDFVENLIAGVTAERMEQIFILFQAYRNVVARLGGGENAESLDFNKFIRWADTILSDFDDADTSLADIDRLFHNVDALKEISANYLTPEQLAVIRDYWKEEDIPEEIKQFWNHLSYPAEEGMVSASAQFIRLWQVMAEVYHEFNSLLAAKGLRTAGRAFREAYKAVRDNAAEDMPFGRYVFVGFNSLSQSEIKLFKAFRDKMTIFGGRESAMGDFYWDIYLPVTQSHPSGQKIGRAVRGYAESFPSEFDILPGENEDHPSAKIDIIGLPSRVAQAKVIGRILPQFFPDEEGSVISPLSLRNTAIILPEEPMLIPLLSSMSPRIGSVNITLGYKLNATAVARLVSEIIGMQMRAYKSKSTGRVTFFYEDVIKVLSNPVMRLRLPRLCSEAILDIHAERLFNVPEAFFQKEKFSRFGNVFRMLAADDAKLAAFGYLDDLMKWITEEIIPAPQVQDEQDEEDEAAEEGVRIDETTDYAIQVAFVRRYRKAVAYLRRLAATYLSEKELAALDNASVFSLIEKTVRGETLNMEGTPYAGLQIMGMLEARALDFENVVIPSMNERIFPRAKGKASFIPMVIRGAYGLPTNTDRDDALAYQFYRLISRCKRVVITYDARTSGTKSGQLSRYALQLLSIFRPEGITHTVLPFAVNTTEKAVPVVYKTDKIMKRLRRYLSQDDPLYLSASSIKQYVNCPMSFYLEKIKRYKREDEVTKWMDDATFGNIVHNVFEQLYNQRLAASPGGALITASVLDDMIRQKAALDRAITVAVNELFHKKGEGCEEPLTGTSLIMGKVIETYVKSTLNAEKALAPFIFKASEHTNQGRYTLRGASGREMTINFHYRIDRIDQTSQDGFNRLRIVDYKTGVDETEASSIDSMMEDSRLKAFLQLILYCDAYSQIEGYDGPIQPVIYRLSRILLNGITPLKGPLPFPEAEKYGFKESARATKFTIYDYKAYAPEVNDRLIDRLEELFDQNEPFRCTDNEDHCHFCAFTAICGRTGAKD